MLAIDIDGVIANSEPFLVKSLEGFTGQKFNPPTPRTYDFRDGFFDLGLDDCLECMFDSLYYNSSVIPVINFNRTYLALSIIQEKYGVVYFVTSRDSGLRTITCEWIKRHFGRINYELHFTGHLEGSKELWMFENDINIIVEDRLKTVNELKNHSNAAFLVNQPWNIDRRIKGHVIRVFDLLDAVEHITEKAYTSTEDNIIGYN